MWTDRQTAVGVFTYWLIFASKLMSTSHLSNMTCCLPAAAADADGDDDDDDSKNAFLAGLLMKS